MAAATKVRVLVVDDSPSTRMMLREALAMDDDIEVVGEAGGGREAVARTAELTPDVVLMDVRMPDGDGAEATRDIAAQCPDSRVVALTWSDDPTTVRDMVAAGAIGYVVKGGTIDELVNAIHRASDGQAELDSRVIPAAVADLRRLLEEERSRREQIERLARARAELTQILSHELRTPLTVIYGALRMLDRPGAPADEAMVVESAIRRAGELEFLVAGLELVASGAPVEGAAHPDRVIRQAAERAGVTLDGFVSASDEVWEGVSEPYLERLAYELLSNAKRHGASPIGASAVREGTMGVLTVTDAGGWAPASNEFVAFHQEDMSATRHQGGFGLGLFLASRLCEACEGSLAIRSIGGETVAEARVRLRPEPAGASVP
jgi:DNA-binding NarL/FixJ family response regulator